MENHEGALKRDQAFWREIHQLSDPTINFPGTTVSFQGGKTGKRCGNGKKRSDTNTFHFRCSWYWMIIEQSENTMQSIQKQNTDHPKKSVCFVFVCVFFFLGGGTNILNKNHSRPRSRNQLQETFQFSTSNLFEIDLPRDGIRAIRGDGSQKKPPFWRCFWMPKNWGNFGVFFAESRGWSKRCSSYS